MGMSASSAVATVITVSNGSSRCSMPGNSMAVMRKLPVSLRCSRAALNSEARWSSSR
jgi:hypothetical protein